MSAPEIITLLIAVWGAVLSTYLAAARRRKRVLVRAEFGVARLGRINNHSFFVLSVVNLGQRAITVREVEWIVSPTESFTLGLWGHSKGKDFPVKVEPDEEERILFDTYFAARALAPSQSAARAIRVRDADDSQHWDVVVTDSLADEAEEEFKREEEMLQEE